MTFYAFDVENVLFKSKGTIGDSDPNESIICTLKKKKNITPRNYMILYFNIGLNSG